MNVVLRDCKNHNDDGKNKCNHKRYTCQNNQLLSNNGRPSSPFWKGKKREKETPLISYTQVYTEFARLNTKN